MKHTDNNPASCPAGASGHTDCPSGGVQQSSPSGPVAGDGCENLHPSWETAWIDLGGEG
jgi:hypothetical protein